MTNLATPLNRAYKEPPGGIKIMPVPLAGYANVGAGNLSHTVYAGAILFYDNSDTAGYARALQSTLTPTTSDSFAGIAKDTVIVGSTDLADGSVQVAAYKDGLHAFPVGSFTRADLTKKAYATDDQTVTATATAGLEIGVFVEIDAQYIWVDIADSCDRKSLTTA